MSDPRGRVLVVDDEFGMREGCRRILTSEGYAVTAAASGEEALAAIAPGAFDLALVDLKMPGMSGMELLPRLREADPQLVCVMCTAYATLETAVQATKSGAYDYVAKPFTPDELLSVVDKAREVRWLTREAARLREEAERNLLLVATEQSRTRTIIQGMADGVLVTNREGKLALYNPAALQLLGIKQLPAIGEDPSPAPFPAALLGWMEEVRTEAAAMVARDLPGGPPFLSVNTAAIRDEAGEALGSVAVIRDVTELKSLQQALADFTHMVAHELRAPLGAIAQYLDVVLGGLAKEPEQERRMLERCRERTQGLAQLVRDLLDFSMRQNQPEGRRVLAPLDLAEVVRETVELLAPTAQTVSVSVDLPENLPHIAADRNEMVSLVTNLVNNAIKYNRPAGTVYVGVRDTGGYLCLEVRDTGLGLPAEAVGRLGEAFYRVKTPETARITGTGLGLSICKQIIAAHHGHLEVESEVGVGSTFRVLLPKQEMLSPRSEPGG